MEPPAADADLEAQEVARPRAASPPWCRFLVLWVCCSLASGVLPGQALFTKLFADAGVFSSACGLEPALGDQHDQLSTARSGQVQPRGHHDHEEEDSVDHRAPPRKTCKAQFVDLTAVFQTGQEIALAFLAPIGVVYDRWGARIIGTVGAGVCALALLMIWASLLGAAAGYDEHFAPVFTAGVLACDFGSMLNSFSFMGLIWHFPRRQTLILALINATYQVSSFLPLGIQALMAALDVDLSSVMLAYVSVVVLCTFTCWKLVPTQLEYYATAKAALGIPLPKPPKTLAPWQMCWRAWEVLRVHSIDHVASGLALGLGFCFPAFYAALAGSYGETLFGTKADGTRLAQLYVFVNGVVGATLAPLSGTFADMFGLKAFMLFLGVLQVVGCATCGLASWPAQTTCTVVMVLWSTLMNLFISRYFLLYSPPNRFGTVQGVYVVLLMLFAVPLNGAGLGVTAMMPPGPDAYRIPMYSYGAAGSLCLFLYAIYFHTHPPPETPPLLPEDERELAGNFGCVTLEEVMEVVHVSTRRELLRMLAASDPDAMLKLVASIDAGRLAEVVARRPVEDLASILEADNGSSDDAAGDGGSDDDDAPSGAVAAAKHVLRSAAVEKPLVADAFAIASESGMTPLKGATGAIAGASPQHSKGKVVEIPARRNDAGETCGCFVYFWKLFPGARAKQISYSALATEDTDVSSTEQAEGVNVEVKATPSDDEKHRIRALAERFERLLTTRDKLGVIDYLLQEPVADISAVSLALEQRMSAAEQKQMDKHFSALIPGSEFARLLRQRPELRIVVQEAMKREMQRKVAAMRRRMG